MVFVIAEAGSNYNGDVETALALNLAAKEAGADYIKYQIINPSGLYRPGSYSYGSYRIEDVLAERNRNVLSDREWELVRDNALENGLPFSASVFDEEGLDLVASMAPPFIKIASTDLNNSLFLEKVAGKGLKTILSTGMATLAEIETSVKLMLRGGLDENLLILFHCVSTYPVGASDTNLAFIPQLRSFGFEVGFSDHSLGVESAVAAVALGATWVEKHFTLNKEAEGLDHKHSLEPFELANFVVRLREIEQSLSPKTEKVSLAELGTASRARRGVYAATELSAGHLIAREDLAVLRPPSPISADRAGELIGKVLPHGMRPGEAFPLQLIEHS